MFTAKLDAAERVLDEARLTEAPVTVALHRYVEGIVSVARQWPVDFSKLQSGDEAIEQRRDDLRARLNAFIERAATEGVLRDGLPPGFARHMMDELVHIVALRYPDMDPPQGADLVVDALLNGIG